MRTLGMIAAFAFAVTAVATIVDKQRADADRVAAHQGSPTREPTQKPTPSPAYASPTDRIPSGAKAEMTYWGTNYGVSLVGMRVTAPKDRGIKDFVLECQYAGATSDTIIRSDRHKVYESVPAGKTRTFNAINLGFAPANAHRGGCTMVSAVPF